MISGLSAAPQPAPRGHRPTCDSSWPGATRCPLEAGSLKHSQAPKHWGMLPLQPLSSEGEADPGSPTSIEEPMASPGTRNSGVQLHGGMPRESPGVGAWEESACRPGLERPPSGNRALPGTHARLCLSWATGQPEANAHVYLGEGNSGPAPPTQSHWGWSQLWATKGSCRPRSLLRGCPWGRHPSLHTMGGWREPALLWALALALACAQQAGKAHAGGSPASWGSPGPGGSRQLRGLCGAPSTMLVPEQILAPWPLPLALATLLLAHELGSRWGQGL